MSDEEWTSPFVRCLGMLLSGDTMDVLNFEGHPVRDETFLLLINAHYEPITFVLPGMEKLEWELMLDTSDERGFLEKTRAFASGDDFELQDRSSSLFRLSGGTQAQARQESWKKRRIELPTSPSAEEERAGKKKSLPAKPK
jgi:glycogen operon protein